MAFVVGNLNFLTFLVGFAACCAGVAAYSPAVAGMVAGVILMAVAVYPLVMVRKD